MGVLAFDDMVLSDLAIPCDVFGRVRVPDGQPLYDVRVCGVRREIRSEHLSLEVPWRISRLQRASTIIVPSISPVDRLVPDELIRALQRAIARGARAASICSGAFVLARTGCAKWTRSDHALAGALWSSDRRLKALLRGDGWIHPAVLHHAVRRTEAEIVHMIGNIGPAMYYARRNDQHVTDFQLDFA